MSNIFQTYRELSEGALDDIMGKPKKNPLAPPMDRSHKEDVVGAQMASDRAHESSRHALLGSEDGHRHAANSHNFAHKYHDKLANKAKSSNDKNAHDYHTHMMKHHETMHKFHSSLK
jgi:hypothetical protein